MADEWENFDWGAPGASTAGVAEGPVDTGGEAAAASPTKKASSWGSGSTSMPSWWMDNAQSYWNNNNQYGGLNNLGNVWSQYFSGEPRYQNNIDAITNNIGNIWSQYYKDGPKYQNEMDSMVGNYGQAWNDYKNLPGQIESQRQNLVNQIYANLPQMRELYQPTLENMSQRGILNSSITGSALGDIQKGVNRDVASQVAGANTWAGDQNIQHTTNMSSIIGNILSGIQGASQQNANFGNQALSGAGNVLDKNLSASGQYTTQGQAAAGVAGNQQNLVNSILELLRQQSQTQGSETWN